MGRVIVVGVAVRRRRRRRRINTQQHKQQKQNITTRDVRGPGQTEQTVSRGGNGQMKRNEAFTDVETRRTTHNNNNNNNNDHQSPSMVLQDELQACVGLFFLCSDVTTTAQLGHVQLRAPPPHTSKERDQEQAVDPLLLSPSERQQDIPARACNLCNYRSFIAPPPASIRVTPPQPQIARFGRRLHKILTLQELQKNLRRIQPLFGFG